MIPEFIPDRPRYNKLRLRSFIYWGTAPRYNAEYRRIRWPSFQRGVWKARVRTDQHDKRMGNWGPRKSGTKSFTDLLYCMIRNIPYKSKTLEYRPQDQIIYINGDPTIQYNLEVGVIESFTFSGKYDPVKSLFLRKFMINIIKKNRKLVWFRGGMNCHGESGQYWDVPTHIDLNEVYGLNQSDQGGNSYIVDMSMLDEWKNWKKKIQMPTPEIEVAELTERILASINPLQGQLLGSQTEETVQQLMGVWTQNAVETNRPNAARQTTRVVNRDFGMWQPNTFLQNVPGNLTAEYTPVLAPRRIPVDFMVTDDGEFDLADFAEDPPILQPLPRT